MSLLETLFAPRRVALVGASDRAGSLGQLLVRNLQEYAGEVVQVRSGGSLRDVEGHIDLAVVAVPAAAAPAVAAEAAAVGVSAMVVLSGGFAETGPQGASLQRELLAAAASGPPAADGHPTRVRVIGPNCFGLQNCDLGFNASIAAGLPTGGGGISLVTQSGAYGMAIYDLAHDDHVRFAKVCAPGNTSDVTVTELVGELADDPATRTLCLLVESLPDGRAFAEQARRAARRMPVVVLKTGRSAAGARAAASHTAALASRAAVWRDIVRGSGAVEVRSGAELLDVARALDTQPLPRGDRVGVITNSGGAGVELTDLLADEGLDVPELSPALQERIRELLPPYASAANPVDLTPAWSLFATAYPALIELLARSGEVDAVVPVLLQRAATDPATCTAVAQAVARLRDDGVEVPVYVCWVAPRTARENAATLQTAGVPVIEWPARTARAVAGARVAARAQERVRDDEPDDAARAPLPSPPTDVGDPLAVRRWLLQAGVDVAPVSLHRTAVGAVDVAQRWFDHGHSDVVVKVARAAHRSDSGGVRLGLRDANAVRAAAEALLSRGDRLLVMPQLTGAEVVVGSAHDPAFGPVVMAGLGGIWVETLADVAFALAPCTRREARDLLTALRGAPRLLGGRGSPPVDLAALADLVVTVSRLAAASPELAAIDLNPVLATPTGAVAVDWKLTAASPSPARSTLA